MTPGKQATCWAAKPTEAERPNKFYIQMDLGESKPVAGVRVLPRQGSNMGDENGTPTEFKGMVSDNGQDWKVLVTKKCSAGTAGWRNWYVVLFDIPANARYVRYEGVHTYSDVAANNDLHMALAEIRALIPVKEEVSADKTALAEVIEQAKTKHEADYTAETWADFADALAAAEEVNADPDAAQDAVDAAQDALEKAMAALAKKPEPTAVPTAVPTVAPQVGATQTGDSTNMMLWAVVALVSGGAAATLYRKRRS